MRKNLLLKTALWLVILSWVSTTSLLAQSKSEKQDIIAQTNVTYLRAQSDMLRQTAEKEKKLAVKKAKQNNWIISKEIERKGYMELQRLNADGRPMYYMTNNANAAATVSTNEVWAGGSAGLDLDGTGMIAGEWDGGDVLTTHQEFNNTGTSRIVDKDGTSSTHYHSTHVAGTIVAAGVQANAKGMAYNATLHAYDWNSDNAEMATAASDGLLLSNHSYGYVAGWAWNGVWWEWYGDPSVSTEEDYRFGFYGWACAEWDNLARNAPYYLIVKAAGNDRGDGAGEPGHPQDGGADGYDCIGYRGNAKNILTVGAVRDVPGGYANPADVEITSFSSWGPADDGRIKPDICGNGYRLYSTDDEHDAAYYYLSGTSMASPNVTGSLLLLQEHYQETTGNYMRAATLKALAIHTADECGPNDGPDYMFGWGLLNTRKAADVITNREVSTIISEETLADGESFTLEVNASGTEPLVATIVWADPAGTPAPAQLDPTDIMLVNDLDMRISDGSSTYYPYMLDGQNPANAATTGDNDVDNVEKIVIDNPGAGPYTITIEHEGVITGDEQAFSLIVSGLGAANNVEVAYSDNEIDDDTNGNSNGNNNGLIEPGEIIELKVELQNTGDAMVHNVNATLSTSDADITITDNTESFGNMAAGNTGWSNANYTFEAAASCPDKDVTFVLNITSDEGSWTDEFVVHVYAEPTITISANNTAICAGEEVVFTASTANVSGNATYQWKLNGNNVGSNSPTYSNSNLSNNDEVFCELDIDGFDVVTSNTLTIEVYPLPTGNTTGTADICEGATADISFVFTGTAPFTFTYTNGNTTQTLTAPTSPYILSTGTAGTYQITELSDAHCAATNLGNSATISVQPKPADAGAITGSVSVCNGATESYSIANISYATNYHWSISPTTAGVITNNNTNSTITFDATYSGTATLSVYASNDCGEGASASLNINIDANATVNAGADISVCESGMATLNGSQTNTSSTLWTTAGDGTFANASALSTTYTPGSNDVASGSVLITLEGMANCGNNPTDNLVLTIDQLPTASAGNDANICETESYTLAATATNYVAVNWITNGDGTFDNATNLQATYTPGTNDINTGSVILTLNVTGYGACDSSITDAMTLSIQKAPGISTNGNMTICANSTAPLQATANNYSAVEWVTLGDGTFSNPNALSTDYTPGNGDIAAGDVTIKVRAYATAPCANTAEAQSVVTIMPLVGNVDTPNGPTEVDTYTTSASTYSIPMVNNATTYQWSIEPDNAATITNNNTEGIFVWNTAYEGNAYISVTVSNQCNSQTSEALQIDIDNTEDVNTSSAMDRYIEIYPNPAHKLLNIHFNDIRERIDIQVNNSAGALVKQLTSNPQDMHNNTMTIDLKAMEPGVYYFIFTADKTKVVKKVIIL